MKVQTKANILVILPEGFERLWALKSKIALKSSDIQKIVWSPEAPQQLGLSGIRAPGTAIPGVFYAGSFFKKGGWEFWYLRMQQSGELVIKTKLHKYRAIRLSLDEATAFDVREWFNNSVKTRNIA